MREFVSPVLLATDICQCGCGQPKPRTAARALVCMLTLVGLAAGIVGVVMLPSPMALIPLGASLFVDAIDGTLARRWNATSDAGAWLDWSTDTALAYAMVFRLGPAHPLVSVTCMAALVLMQTCSRAIGKRASGRTIVTVLAAAWVMS